MHVLAIDQSLTACGAVLLEEREDRFLEANWSCCRRVKSTGIYRLVELHRWIDETVLHFSELPNLLVARERHTHAMHGSGAQLIALNGAIDLIALNRLKISSGKYVLVNAGTWKKFCVGKGNLKKDTAYLVHLNNFFKQSPLLTKVGEVVDDNIADAFCIGVTAWAAWKLRNNEPIEAVTHAQKNILEKNLSSMFDYGEYKDE